MKTKPQSKKSQPSEIITGLFSKAEAAHLIMDGSRHLHSTLLGSMDPCAQITAQMLQNKPGVYPWDLSSKATLLNLSKSSERLEVWQAICSATHFAQRSLNRDILKQILEELLTNSVFHAYKKLGSSDKYDRLLPAELNQEETVTISFAEQKSGLFLNITDHGGSLRFEHFTSCFARCYPKNKGQIPFDQKHEGAGLGLYMIFELASHISVTVDPGKQTSISIWIPQSEQFDPDHFSFNFFER